MHSQDDKTNLTQSPRSDAAMNTLMQVFEGPLRDVTFPDVSYERLHTSRSELDALRIKRAATQLELDRQSTELLRNEAEFAELARTALEYAKVYARNDPATMRDLQHVVLPDRTPVRTPATSKTRKSKAKESTIEALSPDPMHDADALSDDTALVDAAE